MNLRCKLNLLSLVFWEIVSLYLKQEGGGRNRPHTRQWGMKTSSHGIKLIFLSTLADIFSCLFYFDQFLIKQDYVIIDVICESANTIPYWRIVPFIYFLNFLNLVLKK